MPVPSIINLNDATPSATSGRQNVKWQADSGVAPRNVSANFSNIGGTTTIAGTTDTIDQSRQGNVTEYTNSGAVAVALSDPTDANYYTFITVTGTGTVTVTPATGTINGAGTLVLASGLSAFLFWTGSAWLAMVTNTGGGGGAPTAGEYIVGASSAYLPDAAVIPSLYLGPDVLPASPNAFDDEFSGSSLSGSWTWANQGSATASVSNSLLGLQTPGHSGPQLRYIYQAAPATPWRITAKCLTFNGNNGASNFVHNGMLLGDTSAKLETLDIASSGNNTTGIGVNRWTNATTYSAGEGIGFWTSNPTYLSIEDDGINLTFWSSPDGVNFMQQYQESRTAWFASGPTKIGLFLDVETVPAYALLSCDWIRRVL